LVAAQIDEFEFAVKKRHHLDDPAWVEYHRERLKEAAKVRP
jgi:hypothetical protein